jgi:hypothetical protein
MQPSVVYGSVVLAATTPVKPFAIFKDGQTRSGAHTESRVRGLYSLLISSLNKVEDVVALPQRNKYLTVSVVSQSSSSSKALILKMKELLSEIDSRFDGARQLFKLNQLMADLSSVSPDPYLAIVNNQSDHSYFAMLSERMALHITGCYDVVNKSVRLMFSTDENWVQDIREADPMRYIFYRYPQICDRPLFIHTQSLCSRWYSWSNTFTTTDGVLKAFNALEIVLYQNPNLEVIQPRRQMKNGRD